MFADQLTAASGGRRRQRLIAWTTSTGALYAAMINVRKRRVGAPQLLGSIGVANPSGVNDEVGAYGQAIVSWVTATGTASAALYTGG